jgi:hypothetical protein
MYTEGQAHSYIQRDRPTYTRGLTLSCIEGSAHLYQRADSLLNRGVDPLEFTEGSVEPLKRNGSASYPEGSAPTYTYRWVGPLIHLFFLHMASTVL